LASNPEKEQPVEQPDTGPVATLIRLVHAPAKPNAQTPLRIVMLIAITVCLAFAPFPASLVGMLAVLIMALSLGHVIPTTQEKR
jgi:uncharacterized membrane protein